MVMYSSYFMQASRLNRYVRTLWNYIFMGDRIWQGRTNFGSQNWSGGTVFGGGPIFSLQASVKADHGRFGNGTRVNCWSIVVSVE